MSARRLSLVLIALAAGCREAPRPAPDTGARAAAEAFYSAIVRQDWPAAYETLHADGRKQLTRDQFAALAQAYRSRLGFEPGGVAVHSADEHNGTATVHVVVTGAAPHTHRHFKDAVALHRGDSGWGVVLPPNFGRRK